MVDKIEIDIEYAKELFNNGYSMHKIAEILNCSFTKVQKELNSYEFNINNPYKKIDGKNLIAICKSTKKEFLDYDNRSGSITTHLLSLYPNIELPSHYKRKDILNKTFKYWYHDYFDFECRDIKETVKCRYCEWETEDIENNAGSYMNHMLNVHHINVDEYIKNYPEDNKFFKNYLKKIERNKFLKHEDNHVECRVCGEKMKKITQSHLNKHGVSLYEYKLNNNLENVKDYISKSSHDIILKKRKESFFPKKIYKRSKAETEIINYINEFGFDIKINDRTILDGFECDIFIKDLSILIEFNGVYYHSELSGNKDKNYHKNKLVTANSKGYKMIQIFEDEWLFKRDIVKSKILHILGVNKNTKIFARKCSIKEISPTIKNKFLNENHIQGEDRSTISIGAYFNDELISVMTFDNKRIFNKTKDHNNEIYELKRFATDNNYQIIGIASKLLNFFIKKYKPKNIVSFADLRWTIDAKENLYTKIGFKIDKIIQPDYQYIQYKGLYKNKRLHKFAFGKKILKQKFPDIYSDDKTEWEIMQEAGYDRIWDCGKIKYIYDCTSI
jgi:GNAT superfamily N-acetyltransferase